MLVSSSGGAKSLHVSRSQKSAALAEALYTLRSPASCQPLTTPGGAFPASLGCVHGPSAYFGSTAVKARWK
jgi:hypothetical protein